MSNGAEDNKSPWKTAGVVAAFAFGSTNCVPGGGTWTVVTVFLALGVGAVSLLRAAKG